MKIDFLNFLNFFKKNPMFKNLEKKKISYTKNSGNLFKMESIKVLLSKNFNKDSW